MSFQGIGVKSDEDDQPESSVSVPGDSNMDDAARDGDKENVAGDSNKDNAARDDDEDDDCEALKAQLFDNHLYRLWRTGALLKQCTSDEDCDTFEVC